MCNSGNGLLLCRELVPEIIGGCHPALEWRKVIGESFGQDGKRENDVIVQIFTDAGHYGLGEAITTSVMKVPQFASHENTNNSES